MYRSLFRVAIESVCINGDLSSISLSFCGLYCFGGMFDFITEKIGQILIEKIHFGRVEIVFTGLPFSFTAMDPSATSNRSHLSTGTTPHKPAEKRPREGINPRIRRPLSFSSENVPCSLSQSVKRSLSSPRVNTILFLFPFIYFIK